MALDLMNLSLLPTIHYALCWLGVCCCYLIQWQIFWLIPHLFFKWRIWVSKKIKLLSQSLIFNKLPSNDWNADVLMLKLFSHYSKQIQGTSFKLSPYISVTILYKLTLRSLSLAQIQKGSRTSIVSAKECWKSLEDIPQ